ncbi:MAG: hypothetical protein LBB38_02475 [Puniceicoccales bacterium]|nr:hypothetical protein [Puniceicoccales bacterium]
MRKCVRTYMETTPFQGSANNCFVVSMIMRFHGDNADLLLSAVIAILTKGHLKIASGNVSREIDIDDHFAANKNLSLQTLVEDVFADLAEVDQKNSMFCHVLCRLLVISRTCSIKILLEIVWLVLTSIFLFRFKNLSSKKSLMSALILNFHISERTTEAVGGIVRNSIRLRYVRQECHIADASDGASIFASHSDSDKVAAAEIGKNESTATYSISICEGRCGYVFFDSQGDDGALCRIDKAMDSIMPPNSRNWLMHKLCDYGDFSDLACALGFISKNSISDKNGERCTLMICAGNNPLWCHRNFFSDAAVSGAVSLGRPNPQKLAKMLSKYAKEWGIRPGSMVPTYFLSSHGFGGHVMNFIAGEDMLDSAVTKPGAIAILGHTNYKDVGYFGIAKVGSVYKLVGENGGSVYDLYKHDEIFIFNPKLCIFEVAP